MAYREGFRRLRMVGKAVLAAGLIFDAFLLIGFVVALLTRNPAEASFFAIGFFGIPVTVSGLVILCAAWIIEGFVLQPRPPHTPDGRSSDMS